MFYVNLNLQTTYTAYTTMFVLCIKYEFVNVFVCVVDEFHVDYDGIAAALQLQGSV